ncbi:unnamed protein product [Alopecurus aequalis]
MSSSCRRHARSPAVTPPLDDDDLLSEILLHLPPQPSSLPRASLVCRRWRQLVSDPRFFRRFRLHHRRNPPLLGFFDRFRGLAFLPTLEAPNRVPPERFSLQSDDDNYFTSLGCRHGLFLICFQKLLQLLSLINGAVLGAAGDDQHFQVVLVVADVDEEQQEQVLACVYSSKTGSWGNLISKKLPYQANEGSFPTMVYTADAVLAGGCLYWKLAANFDGILEFDLERQSLAAIRVPVDMYGQSNSFKVMRAEGGGLGFLFVSRSDYTAQLWKRMTDCDGVASWGLARTIELDKLLSLKPEEKGPIVILGLAEENNAVFLWTMIGLIMIHLESSKFKKLFETMGFSFYHPFESVYAAACRSTHWWCTQWG